MEVTLKWADAVTFVLFWMALIGVGVSAVWQSWWWAQVLGTATVVFLGLGLYVMMARDQMKKSKK